MISDKTASKIIVFGLAAGLAWLGYCTGREFLNSTSYKVSR